MARTSPELIFDHESTILLTSSQLPVKGHHQDIVQLWRGETARGLERLLDLKAKVLQVKQPHVVSAYPHNKFKRSILLADQTGQIEMVFWRKRAENISFTDGDVLDLANMVVSKFNGQLQLTTTFESSIKVLDKELTIAKPDNIK